MLPWGAGNTVNRRRILHGIFPLATPGPRRIVRRIVETAMTIERPILSMLLAAGIALAAIVPVFPSPDGKEAARKPSACCGQVAATCCHSGCCEEKVPAQPPISSPRGSDRSQDGGLQGLCGGHAPANGDVFSLFSGSRPDAPREASTLVTRHVRLQT